MSDGNAIVGHRHIPLGAVPQTILHFPLVQHAAAAVHDKCILAHVLRKLITRGKRELHIFAGKSANPVRQFFRANIAALAVMRAAFGDEHSIAILQRIQLCSTENRLPQIAFVSGKQDGERGQLDIFRHQLVHNAERLRVRDNQPRRLTQGFQRAGQLGFAGDKRNCACFQNIADGLLLREDQTSFWGGRVDRDDQNDKIIWDLKDRGRDIYPDLLPEPGLQSVLLIHEHGIRLLC